MWKSNWDFSCTSFDVPRDSRVFVRSETVFLYRRFICIQLLLFFARKDSDPKLIYNNFRVGFETAIHAQCNTFTPALGTQPHARTHSFTRSHNDTTKPQSVVFFSFIRFLFCFLLENNNNSIRILCIQHRQRQRRVTLYICIRARARARMYNNN